MQTTAVTDNLIKLTRLHFVNAFLVREANFVTVSDVQLTAQSSGRANSEGDTGHHGLSSTTADASTPV